MPGQTATSCPANRLTEVRNMDIKNRPFAVRQSRESNLPLRRSTNDKMLSQFMRDIPKELKMIAPLFFLLLHLWTRNSERTSSTT
jgi:hypothetical protein